MNLSNKLYHPISETAGNGPLSPTKIESLLPARDISDEATYRRPHNHGLADNYGTFNEFEHHSHSYRDSPLSD